MTIVTILPHRKIESMTSRTPVLTIKSVEYHKNKMIIFYMWKDYKFLQGMLDKGER